MSTPSPRKPPWLTVRLPQGEAFRAVHRTVREHRLHTVCQEARCPNTAECWGAGTATFLLLGGTCTRGCRFCAVTRGDPGGAVDRDEPERIARAADRMGLSHVVLTSVTRDDLVDGGASVFAETVRRLKTLRPAPRVELLLPDLTGEALEAVLAADPDVVAHNVEVVERLTPELRHARFTYRRSLEVLRQARGRPPGRITKSSILLGLGETEAEVTRTMADLREVGVRILALGQYLQPTRDHAPVVAYLAPETFDRLGAMARGMGFDFVAAGPLVRTSYRAAEAHRAGRGAADG